MPLNYPRIWDTTLGATADVSDLPDTASGTSGLASISDIFPPITQIPLKAGGVAPSRADFNALFKLLGDNIYFLQNGGTYVYSATQDYYQGAVVWYDGIQYTALADNGPLFSVGPQDPTHADYWQATIAPQLNPYTNNETLIARIFDKLSATSYTPGGTLTAEQVQTALTSILAAVGACAFLSKENVFNSTQRCNAALPESSFDNVLVTYAQALSIANANAGTPTGVLMPFAGKVIPEGYLLCNGAAVSRTTYAKLFAVIGTLWGSGDGETTFNLPDFTDKFIEGTTDTANVAKFLEAGLPNIIGQINTALMDNASGTGAFSVWSTGTPGGGGSGAAKRSTKLDASVSNSLYNSNITTVQPQSNQVLIIIKT